MILRRHRLKPADLFAPKTSLWGQQANLFSGRLDKVVEGVEAVEMPGATVVIYGDRGVGKTSYAWQLLEILKGNMELRDRYPDLDELDDYECFWIESENRYQNVSGLLLALLRPTVGKKGLTLRDRFPGIFDAKSTDRIDRAYEFNTGIAKAKISIAPGARSKDKTAALLDEVLRQGAGDPYELFGTFLSRAREQSPDKAFIIFVDEFDRLPDRSGMGDFAKHCGEARLVLVGVSESPSELIGDHPSADRKLAGSRIEVPPLSDPEVKEIFRKAEDIVSGTQGYKGLSFSEEFKEAVVGAAGGYPSIAQFLGYEALRANRALRRARDGLVIVELEHYRAATMRIFTMDELKEGVGKSKKRAAILDALGQFDAGWHKTARLRNALAREDQEGFRPNLDRLAAAGIVHLNKTRGRVKFSTPALRLMVKLGKEAGALYPRA